MEFEESITIHNYDYPVITNELIECLQRDFPDKIPRKQLSEFELGKLVGHQEVVDKLIVEKEYNEDKNLEKE